MSKIKKIILSAMLLSLAIVLSRFASIKTPILTISVDFIPIMMCAIWLGPKYSTLVAGLNDFIGALLFPHGAYFPGYTISALLVGLIYGLFLYRKDNKIKNISFIIRLIISSILSLILIGVGLTSIWVNITSGKAVIEFIITRGIYKIIMIPIQVITIYILEKLTRKYANKYLLNKDEI